MSRGQHKFLLTLFATTMLAGTPAAAFAQDAPEPAAQDDARAQTDDVIVVRYRYVPEPKREISQVASFLTDEDFARTGDSDVSGAIRRVTGVNINRGKFVFVRGLGDRFSGVVLNGLTLPSPEPLRRVAPLDIFPTELLRGLSVQKTYSARDSADFGGGLVNLETRLLPAESVRSISVSGEVDTATSFDNALMYDGGEWDRFGFDDGLRDIPGPLQDALLTGLEIDRSNFSAQDLQAIGRSIPNSKLNVLFDGDAPANYGGSLTFGEPFRLFGADSGVFLSGGFDSEWQTKRGERQTAIGSGDNLATPEIFNDFDLFSTQLSTRWSGLATTGLDWGSHELGGTLLYIKSTLKEARVVSGLDGNEGVTSRRESTEWFDRELLTAQATGRHELFGDNGIEILWSAGASEASRDAPFQRSQRYLFDVNGFQLDNTGGLDNNIRFTTIEDRVDSGSIELRYDFDLSDDLAVSLYGGWDGSDTEREAARRDLTFQGFAPRELLRRRIDYIFADQNINPSRFEIEETTSPQFDPNYIGSLVVNGYYLGADIGLGAFISIDAGVRVEESQQIVDTFSPFTENVFLESLIEETDTLPSVAATWTFADGMQLRAAYSETLGRPQFREIAFSEFINVDTDQLFIGNPFLENTALTNYDLKWEWYFARNQFVTAGVFYKELEDPIEEYVTGAVGGGDTVRTGFQQVPGAEIRGAEFEVNYRFALPEFESGPLRVLSRGDLLLAGNYTYSESEVTFGEGDVVVRNSTTRKVELPADQVIAAGRELQGQIAHVFNVQLEWSDADTSVAVLYNYTSDRIRELGVNNLPPVRATDPASLDLRVRRNLDVFGREVAAAFTARNLLGDNFEATQSGGGSTINVDTYDIGTTFSVSLTSQF